MSGHAEAQRYRLDVLPMIALNDVVVVGEVAVGPFAVLGATMFPKAGVRQRAGTMVRYHRRYGGKPIDRPSVVARSDGSALPPSPRPVVEEAIERSIEAFRYVALLANRNGFGPNSTHLHIERYTFSGKPGRFLTLRSRFVNSMGLTNHRQPAWAHIHPVFLAAGNLDRELLAALGAVVRRRAAPARRLWRSLWWFNQAHHDDPYQPQEFSILCLASALEALVRPSSKVSGLQNAIAAAIGSHDFDGWVEEFYGSRSAISHGDEAWQPLFGANRHIDHYRVAREVFPALVRQRLIELGVRSPESPLVQAMLRHHLAGMLSSDEDLIAGLLPHTFASLQLRRNRQARLDLKFLPVRLNSMDISTRPERYAQLVEWIRGIALSCCRSASARYPSERKQFRDAAHSIAAGIPSYSHVGGFMPRDADPMAFFDELAARPENRPLLGDISLTDLVDGMRAADDRRQMTAIRF